MILGVFERDPEARVEEARLRQAIGARARPGTEYQVWVDGPLGLACGGRVLSGEEPGAHFGVAQEGALVAVFSGRLYPADGSMPGGARPAAAAELLAAYRGSGAGVAADLLGSFAFAVADRVDRRLLICRDAIGIESLYYHADQERVVFASSIAPILDYSGLPRELDTQALARFLLFNYNPGLDSLLRGVARLRPAHRLEVGPEGERVSPYWRLSYRDPLRASEGEIAEELLVRVRAAVRRRMPAAGAVPAVFVSGGLDSSTVLGLVREAHPGQIRTYSYCCKSESFDESHYARLMAESVSARHTELEYRAEDALLIAEAVANMTQPFCDVGINIGTYLLGREAAQGGDLVFTGDGGDELFGGHPIYEADKIARFIDPVPFMIRGPMLRVLRALPDSDRKKNLTVKLKRFGESALFPPELLSHRWRLYYHAAELEQVLNPEITRDLDPEGLFREVLEFNREADGPDPLSRSLYSDYQSIVDFYIRRNDLFGHFGVETRYPLFDRDLVEFCASIPSNLKVKGWFDTKYVFKRAIETILPRQIVYRKDKLGHSIPLKNWLREDASVRDFVVDHVRAETVRNRGLIRPEFAERLVREHMSRRRNNSHRLWALTVLELWCRHHLDGGV